MARAPAARARRELLRDATGTLGAVDATNGSGVAQTPFEFSQVFERIATAPPT